MSLSITTPDTEALVEALTDIKTAIEANTTEITKVNTNLVNVKTSLDNMKSSIDAHKTEEVAKLASILENLICDKAYNVLTEGSTGNRSVAYYLASMTAILKKSAEASSQGSGSSGDGSSSGGESGDTPSDTPSEDEISAVDDAIDEASDTIFKHFETYTYGVESQDRLKFQSSEDFNVNKEGQSFDFTRCLYNKFSEKVVEYNKYKADKENLNDERESLQDEHGSIESEIAEHHHRTEELEDVYQELLREHVALDNEEDALRREKESIESYPNITDAQTSRLEAINQRRAEIEQRIGIIAQEMEENGRDIEANDQEIDELNQRLEYVNQRLEEIEQSNRDLEELMEPLKPYLDIKFTEFILLGASRTSNISTVTNTDGLSRVTTWKDVKKVQTVVVIENTISKSCRLYFPVADSISELDKEVFADEKKAIDSAVAKFQEMLGDSFSSVAVIPAESIDQDILQTEYIEKAKLITPTYEYN